MTDYDDYWDHFDELKANRPPCDGNKDTGEHCMISFEGDHVKECADCDYIEPIETWMEKKDDSRN